MRFDGESAPVGVSSRDIKEAFSLVLASPLGGNAEGGWVQGIPAPRRAPGGHTVGKLAERAFRQLPSVL